jgi:hypothetical protein
MGIFVAMRLTKGARFFMRAHGQAAIIRAERPEKYVVVMPPAVAGSNPFRSVARPEARPAVTGVDADTPTSASAPAALPAHARAHDAAGMEAGAVFFNHRNRLATPTPAYAPQHEGPHRTIYGATRRKVRSL